MKLFLILVFCLWMLKIFFLKDQIEESYASWKYEGEKENHQEVSCLMCLMTR